MLGRTYEAQNCSAARALEVVGERWSILLLRDALYRGMTRFSEFQHSLGVAPNVLTARLQTFVREGLMEYAPPPDGGEPSRYVLTDKGRDLAPVIVALTGWGDRWAAPKGPPVVFHHHDCGGHIRQVTVCETCAKEMSPTDLRAEPE